jgi:hypothetical protein
VLAGRQSWLPDAVWRHLPSSATVKSARVYRSNGTERRAKALVAVEVHHAECGNTKRAAIRSHTWIPPRFSSLWSSFCYLAAAAGTAVDAGTVGDCKAECTRPTEHGRGSIQDLIRRIFSMLFAPARAPRAQSSPHVGILAGRTPQSAAAARRSAVVTPCTPSSSVLRPETGRLRRSEPRFGGSETVEGISSPALPTLRCYARR